MQSEDKKLKDDKKENVEVKDNKDKNTEIEENVNVNDQNKINPPLINIRKVSNLSDSIINYFVIAITLFLYASYNLKWFNLADEEGVGKKFIMGYFIISGISLYVIGILNWYEGKELLLLFDFMFSFLFFALFLSEKNLGDISSQFTANNDKLKGLFYIIFFCFILIIGISSKEKGIIFSINYAVLFVGFVFLFAGKFFGNDWIRYAYSYAFIVSAALLWGTGILKLINNGLVNKSIKILEPTD